MGEELTVSQLRNSIRSKEGEIHQVHNMAANLRAFGDALRRQRARDMDVLKDAGLDSSFPRLFSRIEAYYTSPQFSVLCDGLYQSSYEVAKEVQSRESELEELRKDLRMANRGSRGRTY